MWIVGVLTSCVLVPVTQWGGMLEAMRTPRQDCSGPVLLDDRSPEVIAEYERLRGRKNRRCDGKKKWVGVHASMRAALALPASDDLGLAASLDGRSLAETLCLGTAASRAFVSG